MTATFESIYREHHTFVWRTAYWFRTPRDAVEDVVQEVFATVAQQWSQFRNDAKVTTWLYEITRNKAKDRLRGEARHRRKVDAVADSPDERRIADPHDQQEKLDLLGKALDQLDDNQREVFVLANLLGMKHREIAAIQGVCENTVNSRLRLARGKLEEYMQRTATVLRCAAAPATPCTRRRARDVVAT